MHANAFYIFCFRKKFARQKAHVREIVKYKMHFNLYHTLIIFSTNVRKLKVKKIEYKYTKNAIILCIKFSTVMLSNELTGIL